MWKTNVRLPSNQFNSDLNVHCLYVYAVALSIEATNKIESPIKTKKEHTQNVRKKTWKKTTTPEQKTVEKRVKRQVDNSIE